MADMAPPLRSLAFPFLELIILTALSWMLIGWMDSTDVGADLRNLVVLIWAVLALWRFLQPVIRLRRRRFVVTNKRVVVMQGRSVESIPFVQIRSAHRHRGGLNIGVFGYAQPVYFPDVGRTKRVEDLIRRQLP